MTRIEDLEGDTVDESGLDDPIQPLVTSMLKDPHEYETSEPGS